MEETNMTKTNKTKNNSQADFNQLAAVPAFRVVEPLQLARTSNETKQGKKLSGHAAFERMVQVGSTEVFCSSAEWVAQAKTDEIMCHPSIRAGDFSAAEEVVTMKLAEGLVRLRDMGKSGCGRKFVECMAAVGSAKARQMDLSAEVKGLFYSGPIARMAAIGLSRQALLDLKRLARPRQRPNESLGKIIGQEEPGDYSEVKRCLTRWLTRELLPQNWAHQHRVIDANGRKVNGQSSATEAPTKQARHGNAARLEALAAESPVFFDKRKGDRRREFPLPKQG